MRWIYIKAPKTYAFLGLSKGVGFIRFDQRCEAERAIKELNGTIPKNSTEAITVKFANNPSNNKAMAPLAAYLTPQTARRFPGPIHHTTGRFRYNTNGFEKFSIYSHSHFEQNCLSNLLILSSLTSSRYSPLTNDILANSMLSTNTINGSGWCIFVYNLAPETEENVLWQLFGPFGAVQSVKVSICVWKEGGGRR